MELFRLVILLTLSALCYCQPRVTEGDKMDTCEGSVILQLENDTKLSLSKLEILERGGEFEETLYIEHGTKEGTCCFRLRGRRSRYTDITKLGTHEVRMKIKHIEIINCVSKANLLIPVLTTAVGLTLIFLVIFFLIRRRSRMAGQQVPTVEH